MGQYHKVINMDKKFIYSPTSLANGLKLLEQGESLTSTSALALLLSGGWNGERVFLLGDYVEEEDVSGVDNAVELYEEATNNYKNVGWLARKVVTDKISITFEKEYYEIDYKKNHRYNTNLPDNMDIPNWGIAQGEAFDGIDNTEKVAFVNYDKNEKYIGEGRTMREVVSYFAEDFMTDVFILLAGSIRGGSRGGGDTDSQYGGAWAGDRVGIVPAKSVEDFTDITAKV